MLSSFAKVDHSLACGLSLSAAPCIIGDHENALEKLATPVPEIAGVIGTLNDNAAVETIVQPSVPVGRLGLLAGSFNPPTRAHLALAEASLEKVDATLLVIPRRLPHKDFTGASLDQRVAMMTRAVAGDPRLGVAISDGGLVVDMVREAHTHFAASAIHVVCGRDAAERYLTWNYGSPDAVEQMLKQFRLLVASRHGSFLAPEHLAHAIEHLQTVEMDEFSSSRLLELLRDGREDWRALAPDPIHDLIERIYR